jgi:hypothetical protein
MSRSWQSTFSSIKDFGNQLTTLPNRRYDDDRFSPNYAMLNPAASRPGRILLSRSHHGGAQFPKDNPKDARSVFNTR